ncbi:UDP binding domain-containing protein [Stieleria sp.]|uniref:UDP binding domain-containing protein n=1 Tax=Stieleria sp. TaxID=2795976 RepID=UPI0035615E61
MKVTVIGNECIGLVTSASFSIQGHDVIWADEDTSAIDSLRRGERSLEDPGLQDLLDLGASYGRLRISGNVSESVAKSDVVFLAVANSAGRVDDQSHDELDSIAESVACSLKKGAVVVVKGAITCDAIERVESVMQEVSGRRVDVAGHIQSLAEATSVDQTINPRRIVLGVSNVRVGELLYRLYGPLSASADDCRLMMLSPESAEMSQVLQHFENDLVGKQVSIWGVSMESESGTRCNPAAIRLIESLLEMGASVHVHDSAGLQAAEQHFGDRIGHFENKYDAVAGSDALVVMAACSEYIGVDPGVLRWRMRNGVVFDAAQCLNRDWFSRSSFDYYLIGPAPLRHNDASLMGSFTRGRLSRLAA